MEFTTIQLSPHQADFLAWCNSHYKQLLQIKNSGYLDKHGINFTVHLKDNLDIEVIDLHEKYRPT